jgi:hypothetical protein
VIGSDTVTAISQKQTLTALQLLAQRRMYKEYSDSLFIQKEKQKLYIISLKSLNSLRIEKTQLLEANLRECDSINNLKEQRIDLLNKKIKSEQSKKTKSFLTGTAFGLFIGSIILLIKG